MIGYSCPKLEAGMAKRMKIASIFAAALLLAGCEAKEAHTLGQPPAAGPDQHVFLVWKTPANDWMVRFNNDPTEHAPDQARTKLDEKTGPTKFIVHIVGNTQATFKNPGGLSVWVGQKSQSQQGINSTQILGPYLENGNLVFYDLNYGPEVELNYELHFNGAPSVDPIIDNGGGSW